MAKQVKVKGPKVPTTKLDLGGGLDLEALKGPHEYKDKESPLNLRVSSTGARSFSVLFWHHGIKKVRRITLAPRGKKLLPIGEARRIAADPAAAFDAAHVSRELADERREKKARAKQERAAARAAKRLAKSTPTVGELTERWLERERGRLRPATIANYERSVKIIAGDEVAKVRVTDLTRAAAAAFRERVRMTERPRKPAQKKPRARPVTRIALANDVAQYLSTVLRDAVDAGVLGERGVNVMQGLRRIKGEEPRERVLSTDELRRVLTTADEIEGTAGFATLLSLHTGARLGEVLGLPWSELDLGAKLWHLPKARCKSKRNFTLPLSPGALAVLKRIKGKSGSSRWCFPSRVHKGEPISTIQWPLVRLQKLSSTSDWSFHDLRRSVRTVLDELRVPERIAELTMNHLPPRLVRTYNVNRPLDQMREALDALSDHLADLMRVADLGQRKSRAGRR